MSYIILTPVFNEEKYVQKTLESVIKQTVLPNEWIFIDDDSVDCSLSIIKEYEQKFNWIKSFTIKRDKREFGSHVADLINYGLKKINFESYNFLVKLDADLEIDLDIYFESQLEEFAKDQRLGITSGITYSIVNNEKKMTLGRPMWRTGGAMKMYRRECFEMIGGIAPIYGWDGLDEYKAMYRGWKTKTIFTLHVNHLGIDRANHRHKEKWLIRNQGLSYYQRGYPVEYILIKSVKYLDISFISFLYFLNGYFSAFIKKEKRYVDLNEKKFIRRFLYKRFFHIDNLNP